MFMHVRKHEHIYGANMHLQFLYDSEMMTQWGRRLTQLRALQNPTVNFRRGH